MTNFAYPNEGLINGSLQPEVNLIQVGKSEKLAEHSLIQLPISIHLVENNYRPLCFYF